MIYVESPNRRNTIKMASIISGKVALVTGASSGIGEAISIALAKDGAKVAILARRMEKLENISKRITDSGGTCLAVKADVTDRQQVEDAVKNIEAKLGSVDILINNAGVFYATSIKNLKLEAWLRVVDVNIKGVLHCIGATLGPMVKKGSGHVINISSIGGKRALSQQLQAAPYYGSKFFIQGLTSGMRQELAPKGVKVCTICPGGVTTDLFQTAADSDTKAVLDEFFSPGQDKLLENEMILKPEDIAETVSYILKQPSRVGINDVLIEPRALSYV